MKKVVSENRRIGIKHVSEDIGLPIASHHALLNFDQKPRRISITQELLNVVNNDSYLPQKIINGDEM